MASSKLQKETQSYSGLIPIFLSVNYPFISSLKNSSCVKPPFIQTRMTGGANVGSAVFNETSKLFSLRFILSQGANTCINGDCSLPGETLVVNGGCQSSVTVFTVDYDAPNTGTSHRVRSLLKPLVKYIKHPHNYRRSEIKEVEFFD